MKALLVLPLVFLLNGCVLLDAYLMANFDNNEYALVNKVRSQSETIIYNCTNGKQVQSSLNDLEESTRELKNYTQYISHNEDAEQLATGLYVMVANTKKFYDDKNGVVGSFFCKKKLGQIVTASEKIQETYGRKPR